LMIIIENCLSMGWPLGVWAFFHSKKLRCATVWKPLINIKVLKIWRKKKIYLEEIIYLVLYWNTCPSVYRTTLLHVLVHVCVCVCVCTCFLRPPNPCSPGLRAAGGIGRTRTSTCHLDPLGSLLLSERFSSISLPPPPPRRPRVE